MRNKYVYALTSKSEVIAVFSSLKSARTAAKAMREYNETTQLWHKLDRCEIVRTVQDPLTRTTGWVEFYANKYEV